MFRCHVTALSLSSFCKRPFTLARFRYGIVAIAADHDVGAAPDVHVGDHDRRTRLTRARASGAATSGLAMPRTSRPAKDLFGLMPISTSQ